MSQGIFGVRIPGLAIAEGGTGGRTAALARTSLGAQTQDAKGADLASATTTDIGAATGNFVDITGTTTITGFGTVAAGTRRVVQFDGVLILTHNASSLILPGGANITTAAGDVAVMVSLGSGNWICTGFTGQVVASGAIGQIVTAQTVSEFANSTVIPYDDSIPQNTEGDEIDTVAITPKNASSTLLIEWSVPVSGANGMFCSVAVFVDTDAGAIAAQMVELGDNSQAAHTINSGGFTLSAASTTARTYKLRAGPNSGTLHVNEQQDGTSRFSTIGPNVLFKVTEILP